MEVPAPGGGDQFSDLDVLFYRAATTLGPYSASGVIFSGPGRLIGFTAMTTSATAGEFKLWDGSGNGGQQIAHLDVSQGFAILSGPNDPGIKIRRGLYFEKIAGTPEVTVWWVPNLNVPG